MTPQAPPTRVISPRAFPHDPRHEQTRTPLHTIYPHHRIFSQCSKRAESSLLRLPDEILEQITRYLAGFDQGHHLPNFALAHSECRQLARPFQFADVWIMDGELPWRFLRFLLHEDVKLGGLPSIGSCIRSLTFTFRRDFTRYTHHGAEFQGYDEAEEKWYQYWQGMLADLAKVIRNKLPMLERVHWQNVDSELYYIDPPDDASWIGLMPAVLEKTTSSGRVRRFYLEDNQLPIQGAGRAESLLLGSEPLCITDLAIGHNRFTYGVTVWPEAGYLYECILRRTAQSLESLAFNPSVWEDIYSYEEHEDIRFRDGPIYFPNLRKVWCSPEDPYALHPEVVHSFLSGPIESLAPCREFCGVMARSMMGEETIPLPHLRTWAVAGICYEDNEDESWDNAEIHTSLSVAQAYGSQIEDIFIYRLDPAEGWTEDHHLAPAIPYHLASGRFSNLRSLCFAWSWISDLTVFQAIGVHVQTLEELSFGFYPAKDVTGCHEESPGSRDKPLPTHSHLKTALAPLRNLQRLGLFGDEYVADHAGPRWAWHRYLKDHVWFFQGRSRTCRKVGNMPFTGQPWAEGERGHKSPGDSVEDWMTPLLVMGAGAEDSSRCEVREAACKLGTEYATVLPKLQEFMIGRLLVEVRPASG